MKFLAFVVISIVYVALSRCTDDLAERRRNDCDEFRLISDAQRRLCDGEKGHEEFYAILKGAELGLKYCKRVMRWERWNCSENYLEGDKMSFYTLDDGVTKESAFVMAIRAAGMYYSVLKHYQDHQLDCPYDATSLPKTREEEYNRYRKCHQDAWKLVEDYVRLDALPLEDNAKSMNILNSRFGMQVVNEVTENNRNRPLTLRRHWCCGLYSMPKFHTVAEKLHAAYKHKVEKVTSSGSDDDNVEGLQIGGKLLYMEESCDTCRPTSASRRNGRLCYKGEHADVAARHCADVCCNGAYTVVPNVVETHEHNCFLPYNQQCCNEQCETVQRTVSEYSCAT